MLFRSLVKLGTRRAYVVHGYEGIDELSPAGPNQVCEVIDGEVRERIIDPADFGLPPSDAHDLRGGTSAENAATTRAILAGKETGGKLQAVLLNAAGAIAAAGHAEDLAEGIEVARETIDSGAAAERLEELAAFTQWDEAA